MLYFLSLPLHSTPYTLHPTLYTMYFCTFLKIDNLRLTPFLKKVDYCPKKVDSLPENVSFLYLLASGDPDNARLRRYGVLDESYSGILYLSPLNCDTIPAFTQTHLYSTLKNHKKSAIFSCISAKKVVPLQRKLSKISTNIE